MDSSTWSSPQRLRELRELLHRHAHRYYTLDAPEIPGRRIRPPVRELQASKPTSRMGHARFADPARRRQGARRLCRRAPPRAHAEHRTETDTEASGARSSGSSCAPIWQPYRAAQGRPGRARAPAGSRVAGHPAGVAWSPMSPSPSSTAWRSACATRTKACWCRPPPAATASRARGDRTSAPSARSRCASMPGLPALPVPPVLEVRGEVYMRT